MMDQYEATSITLTANEEFFNEFNTEVKPKTLQILDEQTAFECGFKIDVIERDDGYYYITLISDSKRFYPHYVYIQLSYLIENIRIIDPNAMIYDVKRDRSDWYEVDYEMKIKLDYENQNIQMCQFIPIFSIHRSYDLIYQRILLYVRNFYLEKGRIPDNTKEFKKWLIHNYSVIDLNLKIDLANLKLYSFELITKYSRLFTRTDFNEFWARKSLLGLV